MEETIKRDWLKALLQAGINFPLNKTEANLPCPFHDDKVPSLSINVQKGKWICHAYPDECGRGSLTSFLSKYLDISFLAADKLSYDGNASYVDLIEESISALEDDNAPLEEIEFPFNVDVVPKWILNREFSLKTLSKWKCGFDKETGSLVIPIYDENNRLVGWSKRQPEGYHPKYLNSPGLEKNRILFGYNNLEINRDFFCITEGPLDTIWLDQNSFPSIALLGLSLSKKQEDLLSKIQSREIVLCLDNDQAGIYSQIQIYRRLIKYFVVTQINLPAGIKDVQDARDPYLLRTIINNRTPF